MPREIKEQHAYYLRTAEHYDAMHVHQVDEHGKALGGFMGLADVFGPVGSVLDVGAGTGRAIERLKIRWPSARVIGIEPVEALREVAIKEALVQMNSLRGTRSSWPLATTHLTLLSKPARSITSRRQLGQSRNDARGSKRGHDSRQQ